MRIIFVRHGHPNYELDCLTEIGHLQAEAAARRLAGEQLCQIHSSTCGRAAQTAQHIAAPHGLPVISHDFIREISWGAVQEGPVFANGQPWLIADELIRRDEPLLDTDWERHPIQENNSLAQNVRRVAEDFDRWLEGFGYRREGHYYRVERENRDTVMMVSHAGASGAVLAHMLNLPFIYFCKTMSPDFTAITVLQLSGREGDKLAPRLELLNDCRHIDGLRTDVFYTK